MNTHKRGDTWRYIHFADIKDHTGVAVNLTGWTLSSQIRVNDSLLATLTCSWTNVGAQEFQTYLADTTAWPLGLAEMDVQFTAPGGDIVSWPTVTIDIARDVTHA